MALPALACVVSLFGPSDTTDRLWAGQKARSGVCSEGKVKPAPHWGVVCICHRGKHSSEAWDSPKGVCFGLLTCSLQAERELRPEPWFLATERHFAELMSRERASQEKTQREGEEEEGKERGRQWKYALSEGCSSFHLCYSKVVPPNCCNHTKQNLCRRGEFDSRLLL